MIYDELVVCELTILQRLLYEGTEDAYRLARLRNASEDWTDRYRALHRELGLLFIEAGTELISRIDASRQPQAA